MFIFMKKDIAKKMKYSFQDGTFITEALRTFQHKRNIHFNIF